MRSRLLSQAGASFMQIMVTFTGRPRGRRPRGAESQTPFFLARPPPAEGPRVLGPDPGPGLYFCTEVLLSGRPSPEAWTETHVLEVTPRSQRSGGRRISSH